jgi:hypothetical protein
LGERTHPAFSAAISSGSGVNSLASTVDNNSRRTSGVAESLIARRQ